MVINNRYFQFYAYYNKEALPVYFPINFKIGTFEDIFRNEFIPSDRIEKEELNNKRMKYFAATLNILGYQLILEIPCKYVGRYYYGRYIKKYEEKKRK